MKIISRYLPSLFNLIIVTTLIIVIARGYYYEIEWVGVTNKDSSMRTLWDWMELLIIPLVLTLGLWWLNKKEKQNEESRDLEKFRESALQHYLDKISELIINKDIKKSNIKTVARARTFTTLKILDGKRKGLLLDFLSDAMLITHNGNSEDTIIDLQGADFSNVQIEKGYLEDAVMIMANFKNANLKGAYLRGALMEGIILDNADLKHSDVTYEQLATADSLENAIMPNGARYQSKENNIEYNKIKSVKGQFKNSRRYKNCPPINSSVNPKGVSTKGQKE